MTGLLLPRLKLRAQASALLCPASLHEDEQGRNVEHHCTPRHGLLAVLGRQPPLASPLLSPVRFRIHVCVLVFMYGQLEGGVAISFYAIQTQVVVQSRRSRSSKGPPAALFLYRRHQIGGKDPRGSGHTNGPATRAANIGQLISSALDSPAQTSHPLFTLVCPISRRC